MTLSKKALILTTLIGLGALAAVGYALQYSFPFYVLSTGIAAIATLSTYRFAWQVPLVRLPVVYAIYRSYGSCFRGSSVAHGSFVETL
jgi:hypothetical protein